MASLNTVFDKPITVQLLKQRCNMADLPEDELIERLMQLENVVLVNANLTTIDGLDLCLDAVSVDLSCNEITAINSGIIDILPNLKVLNVQENLISEFTNLSESSIEDLNISYNPLTELEINYLPANLKRISICGTDIEESVILIRFPNIEFYITTEMHYESCNEVEEYINKAGTAVTTEEEIIRTKGSANLLGGQALSPRVGNGSNSEMAKKRPSSVKSPIIKKKADESVTQQIQEEELKQINQQDEPLYEQELCDIAKKYQQALDEIEEFKINQFTEHVDDIIAKSKERTTKNYQEVKMQIQRDLDQLEEQTNEQEQRLIKELENQHSALPKVEDMYEE